jgi:Acetyltransferase (GNAT) domain
MLLTKPEIAIRSYSELERLSAPCSALFDAECDFSLGKQWFRNMVANGLPPGSRAVFHVLTFGEEPLALLPLQDRGRGELRSLTNCYTCLYRPLIATGARYDETARRLGRELGRLCAGRPLIRIECLPGDWPALDAFAEGVRASGLLVRRFAQFGNWHEPVRGRSWDEYLASRPGSLRELLRRRRRRVMRAGGISFEIIKTPDSLLRGIEAYEEVYRRSWKPNEPFPRFNAGLMEEACRLGVLRLGICSQGGIPIAAQLWILSHGTATVLKLAHDEAHRALSPGTLLCAEMIAALLQEGIQAIDFGRGDDPYKRLWAEHRRQRIGLILINPRRPAGLATLCRHDLGQAVKTAKRRFGREGARP